MAEAVKEKPMTAPAPEATQEERNLFPESRVKEYLHGLELRIASDALPALDAKVKQMLIAAGNRAKGNKRGTIQAHDL